MYNLQDRRDFLYTHIRTHPFTLNHLQYQTNNNNRKSCHVCQKQDPNPESRATRYSAHRTFADHTAADKPAYPTSAIRKSASSMPQWHSYQPASYRKGSDRSIPPGSPRCRPCPAALSLFGRVRSFIQVTMDGLCCILNQSMIRRLLRKRNEW